MSIKKEWLSYEDCDVSVMRGCYDKDPNNKESKANWCLEVFCDRKIEFLDIASGYIPEHHLKDEDGYYYLLPVERTYKYYDSQLGEKLILADEEEEVLIDLDTQPEP